MAGQTTANKEYQARPYKAYSFEQLCRPRGKMKAERIIVLNCYDKVEIPFKSAGKSRMDFFLCDPPGSIAIVRVKQDKPTDLKAVASDSPPDFVI